jgi:hypothetical protein
MKASQGYIAVVLLNDIAPVFDYPRFCELIAFSHISPSRKELDGYLANPHFGVFKWLAVK